jgi:hypothetical protein
MTEYSWDDCIKRYSEDIKHLEESKAKDPTWFEQTVGGRFNFIQLESNMLLLLEQLKADSEIPELERTISHITLRLWYPDIRAVEISVIPSEGSVLDIGINHLETVSVPLEIAVKTIKRFLKLIRDNFRQPNEIPRSIKIGEVEILKFLPLEWVHAGALEQIFELSLKYGRHEADNILEMTPKDVKELVEAIDKIKHIVMKTWEIAREKRSQAWLEELEKDDD